ncbi:MAG: hypothetical protein DRG83_06495 [Deltaproteobacteria bacterium]|nr:MAG: hypothetical protein DRG83_06495 [Deltaproteobacteria bacterium]
MFCGIFFFLFGPKDTPNWQSNEDSLSTALKIFYRIFEATVTKNCQIPVLDCQKILIRKDIKMIGITKDKTQEKTVTMADNTGFLPVQE